MLMNGSKCEWDHVLFTCKHLSKKHRGVCYFWGKQCFYYNEKHDIGKFLKRENENVKK